MRTISVINLKGGVGKSISAINIADVLAIKGYRVLLIDNDMQGNTSKFYGLHSYDRPSMADVLTVKQYDVHGVIQHTKFSGVDLIPANMTLLRANKEIMMDVSWVQHTRLRKALRAVADDYDYCVIDNTPYVDMCVINALVATDDVLIPIKADRFTLDGLDQLLDSIEQVRDLNESIRVVGGFLTMYQRDLVNMQAHKNLMDPSITPIFAFRTMIHKTTIVDRSTFSGAPLNRDNARCKAAIDYVDLVDEYLLLTGPGQCANN